MGCERDQKGWERDFHYDAFKVLIVISEGAHKYNQVWKEWLCSTQCSSMTLSPPLLPIIVEILLSGITFLHAL